MVAMVFWFGVVSGLVATCIGHHVVRQFSWKNVDEFITNIFVATVVAVCTITTLDSFSPPVNIRVRCAV